MGSVFIYVSACKRNEGQSAEGSRRKYQEINRKHNELKWLEDAQCENTKRFRKNERKV